MFDTANWTRTELERHSVDLRQFIDFRQSTLPNGSRIIEAYNGSGLTYTILPDRGLDIWAAHYKGIPLTWIAQGSPYPPDFGLPWLRQFNGGLLVTCGLTHAGPPENDEQTGQFRDLHGLFSRLRAAHVSVVVDGWSDESTYAIELRGAVSEATLFGEQLRLDRIYRLILGQPVIHITDTVTNVGDAPSPLMVLYHFNLGYPLVSHGVRLYAPSKHVYPRNERARSGYAHWPEYEAATPGFEEQVYFHHVNETGHGESEAALLHADFGLSFAWSSRSLPYLTQWKNARQGIYVSGVEPGNCIPEGQNAARRSGRLELLPPGASRTFHCRLTVLEGSQAVKACQERINQIQQTGAPVAGCKLEDYGK